MAVVLETSIGEITIDLYIKERPRSCLNFLKLCKLKKYNFNLFHTVEQNFIAQTGDPTNSGKGGESVFKLLYGEQATFFEAEIKPRIKHLKKGAISMVNNGTNMHGSQFFITLCENLDYLDNQLHTVFGEVSEGMDIVDKLNQTITDKDHRPYKQIRIFHTVVLDDPFPDPQGLEQFIPLRSPSPIKDSSDLYIGVDEEIVDNSGLSAEEIEERKKEKEAKNNAILLEMIGDLPDADIAPPDNVLFVCKLNSVTTAEDLEVIFSRFGPIESCEVIKDQKTGESLQYAFIEFKNEEDCEKAYFKMDNVLIDDRRIHVDFSQSVSKLKYPVKKIEDKKPEEPAQPKFRIKNPDERKIGNYEYVFEEYDDIQHNKNKRKHTSPITQHKNQANKKKYMRDSPDIQEHKSTENVKKSLVNEIHSKKPTDMKYSRVNSEDDSNNSRDRLYKTHQMQWSDKNIIKNSYNPEESMKRKLHKNTDNSNDYNSHTSRENKHSKYINEESQRSNVCTNQNKPSTLKDYKSKVEYQPSRNRSKSRNKEKYNSNKIQYKSASKYEKNTHKNYTSKFKNDSDEYLYKKSHKSD